MCDGRPQDRASEAVKMSGESLGNRAPLLIRQCAIPNPCRDRGRLRRNLLMSWRLVLKQLHEGYSHDGRAFVEIEQHVSAPRLSDFASGPDCQRLRTGTLPCGDAVTVFTAFGADLPDRRLYRSGWRVAAFGDVRS